jgi:hypothetical protein
MSSQYWKLPLNWDELVEAVRWAAGGTFSLEVEASETPSLVAELIGQPEHNRRIVHLLNYAAPQGSRVGNVRVEVELPEGKRVRQVTLLTPDGGEAASTAPSQLENGRVLFTVPHLKTYAMAVIDLEP